MAKAAGKDHIVVTGKETKVYGPVRDKGSTVVERDDLGPPRKSVEKYDN